MLKYDMKIIFCSYLSFLNPQKVSVSETCKLLLDDVSHGATTGSRLSSNASRNVGACAIADSRGFSLVGASRPTSSSFQGNDFWGVGEDSNGAASTVDAVNGVAHEVEKQGCIHGYPSRVRVGGDHI